MTTNKQALRLFTSDWHLGHQNVSWYRGFSGPDEMDNKIILNFTQTLQENFVSREHDGIQLFFLGDLTSGSATAEARALEIMLSLRKGMEEKYGNVEIHAIGGNHDSWWGGQRKCLKRQKELYQLGVFDTIHEYLRMQFDGNRAYMSHFPYLGGGDHTEDERFPQYRLNYDGSFLIHGHTHFSSPVSAKRQIHVGVDAWDFKPVLYSQIVEMMKFAGEVEAVA